MAFGYSTTVSPFSKSTAIVSDVAKQLISHLINKRSTQSVSDSPRLETLVAGRLTDTSSRNSGP